MDNCEHIQACTDCNKNLCSYCLEDCDGCDKEACENCYTKHLIKCRKCDMLLCPNNLIGDLCPVCKSREGIQ